MVTTSMVLFTALLALVGLERVAELVVSKRNAAWSMSRGGVELGQRHFPAMVVLHTALLVGAGVEVWLTQPDFTAALGWPMLALVLLSQGLRWWCVTTLGRQWNTRVIVVPGTTLVRRGPYRVLAHPNYVAVVVEGIALPLVHNAWLTATVFALANAALLRVRIGVENSALQLLGHEEGRSR